MESHTKKDPTSIDTAEAIIKSEMEKLHNFLFCNSCAKTVMNEMKLFVDLVRKKNLEEGSCRLNYLLSDVVEMVRNASQTIVSEATTWFIMNELKDTNKRLRELEDSRNDGVGEGEGDGDMVGFEEDVKLLLHRINEKEPHAACIRGIAGSGKTTLVRHLYNHTDIVQNFDHRVWVDCTDILSVKELLINLIRQLPGGDDTAAEEMNREDLRMCVNQLLQGKRFFLVLDNVRISFLEYLHFYGVANVLLFTRRTEMGSCIRFYDHEMEPLDVDKSWELLLKKVLLLSNNKVPKKVERKGKAMLMKHCGGLPLAIKEVAMEWVEKRRLGIEWEEVVESEDLELRETLEALDSSVYHSLGPNTKLCFQHLSIFKLGTIIRRRRFLDTWFASGLLGMSIKLKAYYTCLDELENGIVIEYSEKELCISPIFHKLSLKKVEEGKDAALHRVVCCSRERFSRSTDRNEKISCLSFHGGGLFDASPSYWKSFEQLRVLDFEGFGLKFLPETVGELIELRYLGLRNNYIQELPRSLGYLKKLQVLDIVQNFMVEVPDVIWEMDALVDLYMSDIFCMKPLKIEVLKNLRTLTYISVENWAYEVSTLQMMTSLHKLGIEGLDGNSDLSKLFLSLAELENLYELVLRGFRFKNMPSLEGLGLLHRIRRLKLHGRITKLPCPKDFPPNLTELTLVNSNLDDDPMPVLEELPALYYLKLKNAYNGERMVISWAGFPRLKIMYIDELWNLTNIQFEGIDAIFCLEDLEITSCPYLVSLPEKFIRMLDLEE